MHDAIGQRGEALFYMLMTKFHSGMPLFRVAFLGDKWPYADFMVELVGVEGVIPFFFVQVKATQQGYTQREGRLKVKVAVQKLRGLASYPAPCYIVGIDEPDSRH